jgi:oligopeptidase B
MFRAIDAHVPFVDCLTTMLDPTLPLTITEWEEWGNPLEDAEVYWVMKSYSPYDNVKQGVQYPDILATGGLSDPRVGFWEPAKWVQKLRAASPDSRILLKTEMGAGHGGPSGRYDSWKEEALSIACILDSLGLSTT